MNMKTISTVAIMLIALIAFGIGGAAASNPPGDSLVYSANLDMWLPQEKIDAIEAAEAVGLPVPPETPADTEYTNSPEAVATGIHPVGPDWFPPFGPEVLSPTNLWVTQDANRIEAVYAGARGDELQTGLLVVFKQFYTSGDEDSAFKLAPQGTGALTITSVNGSTLSFSSASGQTGTLDLTTEQLQMNP
jgi:hypothetical protein